MRELDALTIVCIKALDFEGNLFGLGEPSEQERLLLRVSDEALRAARERTSDACELDHWCKMSDVRLAALVKAVNAKRIAGFPSGRLFLDSIEQAIAAALVNAFAWQSRSVRPL